LVNIVIACGLEVYKGSLSNIIYELIAECPAFQSVDECINENNSLLIGITWDADRDAPPFKAGRVHFVNKMF